MDKTEIERERCSSLDLMKRHSFWKVKDDLRVEGERTNKADKSSNGNDRHKSIAKKRIQGGHLMVRKGK